MMLAQLEMSPQLFSVLIQGGSFAFLIFLFGYMLPRMRREIRKEHEADLDKHMINNETQRKDFVASLRLMNETSTASVKEISGAFKAEIAAERAACEKHFEALASTVAKGNEGTLQAIKTMSEQTIQHAVRNVQWADALKAEIESRKKQQEQ